MVKLNYFTFPLVIKVISLGQHQRCRSRVSKVSSLGYKQA